ncbi:MAG TPA: nucleotidyltransferase family protein [Terracidiphilus sp.]|nr:nucleotidyltransferase family protein [Terracidiphilus sp.]
MKAMILAAGLGTRLRPLTNDRPKALVEVAGQTMLERALLRLRHFGISEVIVNVHHYAEQVEQFLANRDNFGMRIEISREEELLDTGGGLKKAAWFFLEPGPDFGRPFLVHNVDVLSNIDIARMARFHEGHDALATVAVKDRETSRYLLFDQEGRLCGRRSGTDGEPELVRPAPAAHAVAFSGIHVLSPRIFSRLTEGGAFSIISAYLRLAAEGEQILAFHADEYHWRDLGRPEHVESAAQDIEKGLLADLS